MFYTVYKIKNRINGKIYIGKHETLNVDDGYMGSGRLIKQAIQKYGIENFEKEILYFCDSIQEMNDIESNIVTEEFCSNNDNYNLCPGGKGGFGYINSNGLNGTFDGVQRRLENHKDDIWHQNWLEKKKKGYQRFLANEDKSNQAAKKRVDTIRKRYGDDAFKTFKGRKHDIQTKMKISEKNKENQKGEKNSQYGTCWITKDQINKKISKTELDSYLSNGWTRGRKI